MFNGPFEVRKKNSKGKGGQGRGCIAGPMNALTSGTLAVGDSVGPTSGSWAVSSGGNGYRCFSSNADNNTTFIDAVSSGGTVLAQTTGTVAARSGTTLGSSGTVTLIKGSGPTTGYKNYSSIVIASGAYIVAVPVADIMLIHAAFC